MIKRVSRIVFFVYMFGSEAENGQWPFYKHQELVVVAFKSKQNQCVLYKTRRGKLVWFVYERYEKDSPPFGVWREISDAIFHAKSSKLSLWFFSNILHTNIYFLIYH